MDLLKELYPDDSPVDALPFIWGHDPTPLFVSSTVIVAEQDGTSTTSVCSEVGEVRLFDDIIVADCLFNRSEHSKLLKSCKECMAKDGTSWISFSHHDPEKAPLDLNFFKLAVGAPFYFKITKIRQWQLVDLFVCNDGMDKARGVVYLYHLQHTDDHKEALTSLECVHEPPEVLVEFKPNT